MIWTNIPVRDRLKMRYDKFRAYGRFTEKIEKPAMASAVSAAAVAARAFEAAGKVPPVPAGFMPLPPASSAATAPVIQA